MKTPNNDPDEPAATPEPESGAAEEAGPAERSASATEPSDAGHDDGQAEADRELLTRRAFLNKVAVTGMGVAAGLVSVPVVGFLFAPLFQQSPEVWRPVGPVDKFKVGETVEVTFENSSPLPWSGVAALSAAWLRRNTEQDFTAFSVNCTHLGCPVSWKPDASLFMCPCHGGVYYNNGVVAAGPPPHPLPTYPVRVNNGQVEIEASGIPLSG
jgi:menaquinol-cytochrome c reductase iron-sulfur subunit